MVRGGAVSAEGGTPAGAGNQKSKVKGKKSKEVISRQLSVVSPQPPSGGGSRRVLSESYRDFTEATGQVVGIARHNGSRPLVATARQDTAGSQDVGQNLQLVHRGV